MITFRKNLLFIFNGARIPIIQYSVDLKAVSMGQGQEYHARKLIMESMSAGGWVLLQNVHLSLSFCAEIIDMLVETETIEESFRLWVTTEVHNEFPIGLLQMAIKFTNEPPQGIRASLKRSYQVRICLVIHYINRTRENPGLCIDIIPNCTRKYGLD